MARLAQSVVIFVGALLLLSLPAALSHNHQPEFEVEGQVFCDVCRVNFINSFSVPMPGARVRLECRNDTTEQVTYSLDGVTDAMGKYRLAAIGDRGEELCQVTLVKSGRPDCDEIPADDTAEITLTLQNGLHSDVRLANPLSFNAKQVLPKCAQLFKEMAKDHVNQAYTS